MRRLVLASLFTFLQLLELLLLGGLNVGNREDETNAGGYAANHS